VVCVPFPASRARRHCARGEGHPGKAVPGLARVRARDQWSLRTVACGWDDGGVGSKRERQADRALVAAYHEARLGELVEHVAEAADRFRAGELDALDVDEVLHRYQRAARELWKFCWLAGGGTGLERTAQVLREMAAEGEAVDWWELGARRDRRAQRAGDDAESPLARDTRPENPSSS
jgi:hypothetical protein